MQTQYIPAPDADFAAWSDNFATLIAASPATYGLISGDATAISAAATAFLGAYALTTSPGTRTPAAIADKDAQRAAATLTFRGYAVTISRNPAVSDADKIGVGVNLPNSTRTPIPAPTATPAVSLVSAVPGVTVVQIRNSETPTSKAKPPGSTGVEVWRFVGTAPASDPDTASFLVTTTKSPARLEHDAGQIGRLATFFVRFLTRSGPGGQAQTGPWSSPLTVTLT